MSTGILEGLRTAVLGYDARAASDYATQAVARGIDPLEALQVMTVAIREIGDGFGSGELWLPDLVGAADAMQAAMPVIEAEVQRQGKQRSTLGTIVAGTVFGDIHSIGISIVVALSRAEGFTVVDLGVNVTAEQFVRAVIDEEADLLAMSALLTTTAYEQKRVIDTLTTQGMRSNVKVVVGGGAITEEFAESIGADGYAPTAPLAAELFRKLLVA
jgi:methylmalonyl-CoA mutase cobalamin-binding domain/chain